MVPQSGKIVELPKHYVLCHFPSEERKFRKIKQNALCHTPLHFHWIIFDLFWLKLIFFSTLGGAWACQRQSCRIGRIFLLEWHEPVLASGSQDGSGDGRHQRGHDELSGSSIWRGQRVRPWKRGEQPVLFELQSALCISKKFRLWWYT